MGKYIAEVCVKRLINANATIKGARVGIFGCTFKENVPDIRNTRVLDIVNELMEYGICPLVHDPCADPDETKREYGLSLVPWEELTHLDAIIIAVAHNEYKNLRPSDMKACFAKPPYIVLDIKCVLDKATALRENLDLWRL